MTIGRWGERHAIALTQISAIAISSLFVWIFEVRVPVEPVFVEAQEAS
jgi:hypothetical protein